MENQVAVLGKTFYNEHLKNLLEPEHNGEFVTIDYETGQYFLGKTDVEAMKNGKANLPDKKLLLVRIGFEAAYKIGGYYARRTTRQSE
jgi:peptide subunit release factor 1 (eRF1)